MKTFFKMFFASLLALVAFFTIPFFLFLGIVTAISSFGEKETIISSNSILQIDLSTPFVDKVGENPMEYMDFQTFKINMPTTTNKAVQAIISAGSDPKIEAMFIDTRNGNANSIATIEELRNAIKEFKKSGKKVYSYGTYGNAAYYFASVADSVIVSPVGGVEWIGLSGQVQYYKDMFDKIGIDVNLIRVGKYKSAGEPYIKNSMSKENREQTSAMIGSIWNRMTQEVSESRNISSEELNNFADNLNATEPEEALENKLVDAIMYPDEVTSLLDEKFGKKSKFLAIQKYASTMLSIRSKNKEGKPVLTSKNRIAILYAVGAIIDGKSTDGTIGDKDFRRNVIKLRKDSTVKAVVLRINSPGGSANASELMWRELTLLQKEKPLIVSMGDYAASGGYYIATPADFIFAQPTTLTGSIGVFATLFDISKTMKKIGVNTEVVNTNKNSDVMASALSFNKMSQSARNYFQKSVNKVYKTFKTRVSEGRNLDMDKVEELAQGRVWTGADALQNGLVDAHGGLTEAIITAAERANIQDDFIVIDNNKVSPNMQMLVNVMQTKIKALSKPDFGVFQKEYDFVMNLKNGSEIQTLIPYSINIQ